MICEAADLIVAPFPFTDLPIAKTRPLLVLSSAASNEAAGQTLTAMITTAARSRWPTDVALDDWATAGLRTPCVIRWKLFTIDNRQIARKIGELSPADRQRASVAAREVIAL